MDEQSFKSTEHLVDSKPHNFGSIEGGSQQNTSSGQQPAESDKMRITPEFYTKWIRPLFAEYFGQLLFVFLHCSSANTNTIMPETAIQPAISDGLTVGGIILLFNHLSGAHVNFAVTTAVFIAGGIKWKLVPFYLIAQLLGSLTGAGLALVTNGRAMGQFGIGPEVSVGRGLLMEVVLACFLYMAVLMVGVDLGSPMVAFAVGFTVIAGILAGFNISGGCMNPTLSFGPAVVSGQWDNYWIYWVGPLLAALITGTLFRLFLGSENRLLFRRKSSQESPVSNMHTTDKGNTSQLPIAGSYM